MLVCVIERETCVDEAILAEDRPTTGQGAFETKAGGARPPSPPAAPVTSDQGEFRFHRRANVRVVQHSDGVAILDDDGSVTVLDGALVRAAYHQVGGESRPPVVDARVVQG